MKFLAKFLKNLYMGFRATLKFWKFKVALNTMFGRCVFLIVSVLDSRASSLGFEPWSGTLSCVLGQDTSLSQCLSPPRGVNGYQQILCLRVTLWWISIPSRRERKYSWLLYATRPTETRISSGLMSHLACLQTFTFDWTLCTEFVLSHPRKITGDAKKADFPSSIYKLKVWS